MWTDVDMIILNFKLLQNQEFSKLEAVLWRAFEGRLKLTFSGTKTQFVTLPTAGVSGLTSPMHVSSTCSLIMSHIWSDTHILVLMLEQARTFESVSKPVLEPENTTSPR